MTAALRRQAARWHNTDRRSLCRLEAQTEGGRRPKRRRHSDPLIHKRGTSAADLPQDPPTIQTPAFPDHGDRNRPRTRRNRSLICLRWQSKRTPERWLTHLGRIGCVSGWRPGGPWSERSSSRWS